MLVNYLLYHPIEYYIFLPTYFSQIISLIKLPLVLKNLYNLLILLVKYLKTNFISQLLVLNYYNLDCNTYLPLHPNDYLVQDHICLMVLKKYSYVHLLHIVPNL